MHSYPARLDAQQVRGWQQVLANVGSATELVVDARPTARWRGEAPEPRPGLPSGHIPGSVSLQWSDVLQEGRWVGGVQGEETMLRHASVECAARGQIGNAVAGMLHGGGGGGGGGALLLGLAAAGCVTWVQGSPLPVQPASLLLVFSPRPPPPG